MASENIAANRSGVPKSAEAMCSPYFATCASTSDAGGWPGTCLAVPSTRMTSEPSAVSSSVNVTLGFAAMLRSLSFPGWL